jgi:four helix bundle protein
MELRRAVYSSPGEPGKRGFEDLECFKLALDVIVNAHDLAKMLPADEKFDMAPQIRRASKSITANIAEGYGRFHYLDSLKFYSNARGSLNETLGHFINAMVLRYIEQKYFDQVYDLIRQTEKALNGYMSYVRKQKAGDELHGGRAMREESVEYESGSDLPPNEEMKSSE